MANLYIDTCCFIDLLRGVAGVDIVEGREQDIWYTERIIDASKANDMQAHTSFLTFAECTHVRDDNHNRIITDEIKDLIESWLLSPTGGITLVEPTIFVVDRIRQLAWEHNIYMKGFDSIHVASALDSNCDEFLTYDDRIGSDTREAIYNITGLRICRPSETGLLPNEYRQDELLDGQEENQPD